MPGTRAIVSWGRWLIGVRDRFPAFFVLLPLILMGMMAWLSHRPLQVNLDHGGDLVAHFLAFGVLASLWALALVGSESRGSTGAIAAIAITALWGVLDEVHQSFVPGRVASMADVLADLAGSLIFGWASARWIRALPREAME